MFRNECQMTSLKAFIKVTTAVTTSEAQRRWKLARLDSMNTSSVTHKGKSDEKIAHRVI